MEMLVIILLVPLVTCHGVRNERSEMMKSAYQMHPSPQSHNENSKSRNHLEYYEMTSHYWRIQAQQKLQEQLERTMNTNIAKNLILFVGDGMSLTTVTAARIYAGQKTGSTGEEGTLSFEKFPNIGLSKTFCVDKQTADSACSATAYLCGVKANYATVGVNGRVRHNECESSLNENNHVDSIMKWAQVAGKSSGIVTTTRITHASPAGTYAHTANRDWESDADMITFPEAANCSDIAKQLVREDGFNLNVVFGGGRAKFISHKIIDEEGQRGQRLDDIDLIDEWLEKRNSPKAFYIHDRKGLMNLNYSDAEFVLGLFESDHMQYHLNANLETEPTLKEMTLAAIEVMKKNEKGFVLFVEGGRIDHAHHDNMARHALEETVEFSEAIQAAVDITDQKDTLIVVTSDHSHTMSLSGYSQRGKDILGLNSEMSDIDQMPYMTLNYANGPSYKARYKLTEKETCNKIIFLLIQAQFNHI